MRTIFPRMARFASAAVLPVIFIAAQPVADGLSYDFTMKTTSRATGNVEKITLSGRGIYAGDNAKIEIVAAAASAGGQEVFGGKGTYFIVKGGGEEMLLVDPAKKTYAKWDMNSMFAGLSAALNAVGGLVKMEISDVRIDTKDVGNGPAIQGYSTRHVQMIQNYTMTMSVFGKKSKTRTESTTDFYFAPTLRIANPFVSNSQQMSAIGDMFNNPDYKRQMLAANAKLPKTGVPLRTVTTMISTDDKGKAETSTSVMEMTNFKPSNIPSSEFAIPGDYAAVEMPSLNASLAASKTGDAKEGPVLNADSVATAAKKGAAEGVKEATKDAAKDAAKNKIKGIFGGKKK